jgi:hypothetical protein
MICFMFFGFIGCIILTDWVVTGIVSLVIVAEFALVAGNTILGKKINDRKKICQERLTMVMYTF